MSTKNILLVLDNEWLFLIKNNTKY
jgi:hypothetical protein